VTLTRDRFPFYLAAKTIQPRTVYAIAVPKTGGNLQPFTVSLGAPAANESDSPVPVPLELERNVPLFGQALFRSADPGGVAAIDASPSRGTWNVQLARTTTQPLTKAQFTALRDALGDIFLVIGYGTAP
jgi:hypothetical protein